MRVFDFMKYTYIDGAGSARHFTLQSQMLVSSVAVAKRRMRADPDFKRLLKDPDFDSGCLLSLDGRDSRQRYWSTRSTAGFRWEIWPRTVHHR